MNLPPKKDFASNVILSSDDARAQYWSGPISRKETQQVFDQYANIIAQLQTKLIHLEFALSYLVEKFEIKSADIEDWMKRKMAEFKKEQEAAAQGAQEGPVQ